MSKIVEFIKTAFAANDSWTGKDKYLHLAGGFLVAFTVSALTDGFNYGLGSGILAGVGKEVYDSYNGGQVSAKDFTITSVGGLIGATAGRLILQFFG
jgi:uncharacterized protein YfiM (DUF2279 family)